MDDLAGLDWNAAPSAKQASKPTAPPGSNYFPSLRPQATPPVSGRSTPAGASAGGLGGGGGIGGGLGARTTGGSGGGATFGNKPATPSNSAQAKDSFANLLGGAPNANSNKKLSLAEQQRQLQQQKLQQQQQLSGSSFAANPISDEAWSRLGGGTGTASVGFGSQANTPARTSASPLGSYQASGPKIQAPSAIRVNSSLGKSTESEEDILAAFNADAPVDRSSHFPPPSSGQNSSKGTPKPAQLIGGNSSGLLGGDDDDPFGLGTSAPKSTYNASQPPVLSTDEDDILGDLGKPVSELPSRPVHTSPPTVEPESSDDDGPSDKAVAELVDMGFPAEKATRALNVTGGDVQAAVSWLLNQAHAESRSKSRTPIDGERQSQRRPNESSRSSSTQRRGDTGSQGADDRDSSQKASELGASLWKGANALWKSSKKQFDKAVADFNTEQGSSQPKWMRETGSSRSSSTARPEPGAPTGATDEAMMLDSHDARPQARTRKQDSNSPDSSSRPSRDQSPVLPVRPSSTQGSPARPAWQQQQQQQQIPTARSKLSRQMVEQEETQGYVSPARRKKPAAKPTPEADLLDGSSAPPPSQPPRPPASTPSSRPAPTKPNPTIARPAAKARSVPSISPITMKSCTQHRAAGTASFKRGDYGSAETSYSSAITALPSTHPLVILLLTNRATTRLKTGDTKGALTDADQAIELVGPARGSGEAIDVPDEDGSGKTTSKEMGSFWGKAIMKRAEALEHMEKWSDAAAAWRIAVEGGVGGANAIQGRNRCENAARPKQAAPKPVAKPAATVTKPRAPAARPTAARNNESAQAVNRLREANKAAERVDDEKFRLADSVDAKVEQWRKGKEANLRALLVSLDTVLWEGSGWKKVGMGELLVPNKVKIAYMKGIGKVHPDKLAQTATTEQIMISGAVFSTLNEAWDKFKAENGL